jgi:hypothetical protein
VLVCCYSGKGAALKIRNAGIIGKRETNEKSYLALRRRFVRDGL